MGWMEPLDETAQNYKQLNIKMGGDPDNSYASLEIDELYH